MQNQTKLGKFVVRLNAVVTALIHCSVYKYMVRDGAQSCSISMVFCTIKSTEKEEKLSRHNIIEIEIYASSRSGILAIYKTLPTKKYS